MRHRIRSRKLGRTSAHRLAMYRNLVTSLLDRERIQTTDAKAKEVRRIADRMITLGKRGGLHARRRALRIIRHREVAAKVFDDLAERYRERPGGYTRVVKLRRRAGDAAPISVVELVEGIEAAAGGKRASTRKRSTRAAGGAATAKETPAKKAKAKAKASKVPARKASTKKPSTRKKASTEKATAGKSPAKKTTRKKTTRKKT